MASKQEENGSVDTRTPTCSPGQILKAEEDEQGWLADGALPAHHCAAAAFAGWCPAHWGNRTARTGLTAPRWDGLWLRHRYKNQDSWGPGGGCLMTLIC